jgi:hypothetical protein
MGVARHICPRIISPIEQFFPIHMFWVTYSYDLIALSRQLHFSASNFEMLSK